MAGNAGKQQGLVKCSTGIQGLDEITGGGLPMGRATLVCGAAGSGKTLLGMHFLLNGALEHDEPGAFIAFEETAEELTLNVASLGFDLQDLVDRRKLDIDHVRVERSEIEETGEYDLEGLFIRLGLAIDSIGAKRVVLDTIESLFSGFSNAAILRAELRRLFRWLKDKGVTAVITGERSNGGLTRHGLEEFVSDCVVLLDHRVVDNVSTRRLRIVKYRGSAHGTNEYPFLIDEDGISVFPITSLSLDHAASNERISSGIPRLDAMLGGRGYYRGSSILVSGTAGTGKSTIAAHFAAATCQRGERCLYLAFEESPAQIVRNMQSIGLDLQRFIDADLLRLRAARPTLQGLELHLTTIHKQVDQFDPRVVILDPITNLPAAGSGQDANWMLIRVIDFLKARQITALLTSLTSGGQDLEATEVGVSSLVDAWLLLRILEVNGERNRVLNILKSRGTGHSNQVREFALSDRGIELIDVYLGPEGVLTGSARLVQEARSRCAERVQQQEFEQRKNESARKQQLIESQIAALRAELEAEQEQLNRVLEEHRVQQHHRAVARAAMADQRQADREDSAVSRQHPTRGDTR